MGAEYSDAHLKFSQLSADSRAIEVWKFPNGDEFLDNHITESGIENWLRKAPQKSKGGQDHVAGLRFIAQAREPAQNGLYKLPFQKETFEYLLHEWGFSAVEMPWAATHIGGYRVFVVESKDPESKDAMRINFVLGGGMHKYSIGGVFSYDCTSNITTGYLVSGLPIKEWVDEMRIKFRTIPHPMTVAVNMAEVLMHTSMSLRRDFIGRVRLMEDMTKKYSAIRSGYRPLAVQLGGINQDHGLTQLTLDRARLHLEFVAEHLRSKQDSPFWCQSCLNEANKDLLSHIEFNLSSIKFMKSEQENTLLRIQSQGIVISNLTAERDMDTSIKVASDSRELAAASRKDSAAMRTIAVVTTVFLPGTFMAAFFSMPLITWGPSASTGITYPHLWIYFAITIPLTATTVIVMLTWLRQQDRKHMELAKEARSNGDVEGGTGESESESGESKNESGESKSESGENKKARVSVLLPNQFIG